MIWLFKISEIDNNGRYDAYCLLQYSVAFIAFASSLTARSSRGARQRTPCLLVEEGVNDVADEDQQIAQYDQNACNVHHQNLQGALFVRVKVEHRFLDIEPYAAGNQLSV